MTLKFSQLAIAALAGAGLTALVFTTTPLRAQTQTLWRPGWMHHPGYWQGGPNGPRGGGMPCLDDDQGFDPAALETLNGTVTAVEQYGGRRGVFLDMQTGQETVEVHLGPDWYLESQGFTVQNHSPIEVTGYRNNFDGHAEIMAATVKQGSQEIRLRDANGYPLWMQQDWPDNSGMMDDF